jgi:3-(3-hydroxy-phenyl)propionate hydroxylase
MDCDVIIAGAGPTGLTLANHLGTLGVRVIVIEKLPTLIDYPRGVGIDDEALRSFQAVGLVDEVRQHTVPNQIMRFIDKRGRLLAAIAPTAQPFGWPRRSGFIQPLVDRELAEGLKRFPHVSLQFQRSMAGFSETRDGIRVDVQPVDEHGHDTGTPQAIHARYLVGCDGGRSPVRTTLGLPFDGKSESTRWLVIDIADEPVGTPNVCFVLDDEFPYVELALPHGVRRYEFMVPEGADEAEFESDARVQALLARVLPAHVKPNVIRRRVYMHHARIAPTFRQGRAFLAGDAAHLMPVWQGQGFNTGIRDASNLA